MRKKGFTLIELIVVAALLSTIMLSIAPYFYTMKSTTFLADPKSDLMQNTRIAIEQMTKELRQAKKIVSVTESIDPNGKIIFINQTGEEIGFLKYNNGKNEMLGYIKNNQISTICGPINYLFFEALTIDATTEAKTVSLAKSLRIKIEIVDEKGNISPEQIETIVVFRKDFLSALYYTSFSQRQIHITGFGTINGDMHANNIVEKHNFVKINGKLTDQDNNIFVPVPTFNFDCYIAKYPALTSYESSANNTYDTNYTFTEAGSPYEGIYYIRNKKSATFQANSRLNGMLIVEGDVNINGNNVVISSINGNPAVMVGNNLNINAWNFECNGTVYVENDINQLGINTQIYSSTNDRIALIVKGKISSDFDSFSINGTTICYNTISLNLGSAVFNSASNYPALLCDKNLTVRFHNFMANGLIYSRRKVDINYSSVSVYGLILSEALIDYNGIVSIDYDPNILYNPPPYIYD